MKFFVLVAFLVLGTAKASDALKGFGLVGHAALGGVLKSMVVPGAIPVGTIESTFGYEVFDFSHIKGGKFNRASYCVSSLEFSLNPTYLGVGFGGSMYSARTLGTACDPNSLDTVPGQDLLFSISVKKENNHHEVAMGLGLSIGFGMDEFLDRLERHFGGYPLSTRTPSQRLKRLHLHLMSYLNEKGRPKVEKWPSLFLRLISSPLLFVSEGMESVVSLTQKDLQLLKNIGKVQFRPKDWLADAFESMRKDPAFYECSQKDCEEIMVDFLNYSEILVDAVQDCHGMNEYTQVASDYSLDITKNVPVSVSFGFAVTSLDRSFLSGQRPGALAIEEFGLHNFKKHSPACEETPRKTATRFARFLKLWGLGKK